ncbi:hypothetical protein OBBRIDRAFT_788922 [Obba rivulosa]|uniref:Uncharacterized protein n=1 Tax=Obba rivulosa TaxID=1052685 RepID=A0A8E2DS26_9APHY|nr:hypothetical protein OBBRIDRAFT_788922 [Obba rivulosa]
MSSDMSSDKIIPPAPRGSSDARLETTAAWQAAEASDDRLAHEVAENADQLQYAAHAAAEQAKVKEPQAVSAVNQLEAGLANQTNTAAAQGKFDVESAKATGAKALEQAKNIASNAIQTAQSMIPESATAAASSAVQTGKEYLSAAQAAAQPAVEKAKNYASGASPSSVTGVGTVQSRPNEPPATSAPLESGPHVVGNPYPATASGQSVKVAEV